MTGKKSLTKHVACLRDHRVLELGYMYEYIRINKAASYENLLFAFKTNAQSIYTITAQLTCLCSRYIHSATTLLPKASSHPLCYNDMLVS